MDHHSPQLSDGLDSDVPQSEVWCYDPDVPEGHFSKLTSPGHGDADSTASCADVVAEGLPEVETFVGKSPNTVE